MKRKIRILSISIFASICCFASSCYADDSNSITTPTIVGAKLTIYKNDEPTNYTVISTSSSATIIEESYTFALNETYIIEASYIFTGGNVEVKLVADTVSFDYDANILEIDKCLEDNESDTTYYLSGIQSGSSTFKSTIDEYEIETTFIFE